MGKGRTEGVKTLLGDPRKAIWKLALPMMIAMSIQTLYNLVDAIWVSGLGPEALAAVGFFFPFFFMAMALAIGIGIGGGAAISRRIGSKDKKGADQVAMHTLAIMVLIAITFTIPMFLMADMIFEAMGAGDAKEMATSYGRILFAGSIVIFFSNIANAIMRAEGDAKRAMYAMIVGSVMNLVLDPIFIYGFDLGVTGAAWATLLSMAISSLMLFYWLFFKKDTFISFPFRKFRPNMSVIKDIMRVGLPASLQQMSMSINMFILILIVGFVGGIHGVAVFTAGWRVITLAILPVMGISTAMVSVAGATYGAEAYRKLRSAHRYAVKMGLIIELTMAVLTFAFAPWIVRMFTWSEGSAVLYDDLVIFVRIMCIFYPFVAFGMLSSSAFQGMGKGFRSLVVTLLRTLILTAICSYVLGVVLDLGLVGIWFGIFLGNSIGSIVAFTWAKLTIRKLIKEKYG
ncbi:MAG: MATE family efflux transporter [Thermoplasmata archaeon]|nr:MATE family efflux transporter [Thermoplasmata archaeon]